MFAFLKNVVYSHTNPKYRKMPYRRLPNTDIARLARFNAALKMGSTLFHTDLAISQSLLLKLRAFYPYSNKLSIISEKL